ncbi:MAG: hypothetical protein CLLPBCKN_001106 [Chroococcidiopsis cubana SAG 39.79]|nr:hypothetical protein [Chroococcidiopsis cubana SAG 39.79]
MSIITQFFTKINCVGLDYKTAIAPHYRLPITNCQITNFAEKPTKQMWLREVK